MDYSRALGAEFRQVEERDRDGKPVRVVIASRTYDTDANDLWDALTNAERIPRWFLPITGELKVNGRYQLKGNAGGVIERCDPPEALDITWEMAGSVSWVALRLTPDGGGTRLVLEHSMRKDPASEAHWKQYGPGATGVGWELGIRGLDLHLSNGGAAVDAGRFEAWTASEAGKAFIREIAKAWAQAHTVSGEASAVAHEMAGRTANFYTGE